ncbi:hypothetical protein [Ruficoccus sp. ZRK36]|uniref:hypothetical protein n=1 Tax=Ruficoccus sp. ZRK36 TaxID=2866311 RepID=UPI001C737678|nr:hypothetical protein [Ruficoccus sp. ZRK36]QYY34618.1 hypothetical protein K0V07_09915 [Ruficoccus sp. ZRK36]
MIRRDQVRRMESLCWHTQSRALAASAIWSKTAGQALGRFERALRTDTANPSATKPADLHRLYGGAGVPVHPLPDT